ncbi:MAG: septum formation initiator family protein [Ignavibacteriales bacterium]|nr:septum formation initiator family protein [Ignavibacteriales bacterium]MCF8306068.1 septum formation initiator family protein [Ignavibacteriales bacterium]MCF8315877.1 septum formation initiator family protein [Ignavibacteriales bacterium]MCF8437337.1 septum formation initiator family protein [Ignavibacteriales bacterium]
MKLSKYNTRKNRFLAYVAIFLIVLALLAFNENGLIKYFSLKSSVNELQEEIAQREKKIEDMKKEIDSLKTNPNKKEEVAREKYLMRKPGEKIIIVKEKEVND